MKSFKIFFAALTALMFAVCARAENISGGEKLARECAAYMDWDFDGKPVTVGGRPVTIVEWLAAQRCL